MSRLRIISAAGLIMATASPAFAHLDHGAHGSIVAGFTHPLFGLDHIIAMVAVGLWAATMGATNPHKAAMIAMPCTFVAAMIAGFGLALIGLALPLVEPMILASVIALGSLVALAIKVDLRIALGMVALFGLFHGHAHGAELGGAGALQFGTGFVLATVLLHLGGIGLGLRLGHNAVATRLLGAAAAMGGVVLAFA